MKKPTSGRREFLEGLATAGASLAMTSSIFGGLSLLGGKARAEAAAAASNDRYYVFAYFSGGWDILVGLDPKDPQVFTASNFRQTRIMPGYELLVGSDGRMIDAGNFRFGPYIGELARHADKLAVVRGMSMDTLTHEVGRRRFLTGRPPTGLLARGSSTATWMASRFGRNEPIPNLAVNVESYNADQPTYASGMKVNGVPDLLRALQPSGTPLDPRVAAQVSSHLGEECACPGHAESEFVQASELTRLKAQDMASRGLAKFFDFSQNTPEMIALRAHYGVNPQDSSTPEAQAALASRALFSGVSRCVSIQATSGLDTHFQNWTTDQGPTQRRGFNAVARLIDDLARTEYQHTGTSWLDHTTIVGFSEFSRTSNLNDTNGRDHSLTNACFLAGGRIKGGTLVGASSDVGMGPQLVDLATGRVDAGGELIRPDHVLRTLYEDAGLGDAADLRVPPIPALLRG